MYMYDSIYNAPLLQPKQSRVTHKTLFSSVQLRYYLKKQHTRWRTC